MNEVMEKPEISPAENTEESRTYFFENTELFRQEIEKISKQLSEYALDLHKRKAHLRKLADPKTNFPKVRNEETINKAQLETLEQIREAKKIISDLVERLNEYQKIFEDMTSVDQQLREMDIKGIQ